MTSYYYLAQRLSQVLSFSTCVPLSFRCSNGSMRLGLQITDRDTILGPSAVQPVHVYGPVGCLPEILLIILDHSMRIARRAKLRKGLDVRMHAPPHHSKSQPRTEINSEGMSPEALPSFFPTFPLRSFPDRNHSETPCNHSTSPHLGLTPQPIRLVSQILGLNARGVRGICPRLSGFPRVHSTRRLAHRT